MTKEKDGIDIELRRALVFAHLMRSDGSSPLHRKSLEYIREKWMLVKNHPCPETLLHMSLRAELFSHLDAWWGLTPEYKKEMKKWGVI